MRNDINSGKFIVPVYINEKIVLDMLAIMDDGFSMVSQVHFEEQKNNESTKKADASISTSAVLSKLLRINISGEVNHLENAGEKEKVSKEKVHTNVSLLSKFRIFLEQHSMLKKSFEVADIHVGDFIEVEGELKKNPLIDFMESFLDLYRMANIFSDNPQLGNKSQSAQKKQQEGQLLKQITSFVDELKHSGTIDFVLSDEKGSVILSAQEQYLANDNISEIIGGRFKVLGKVIYVCEGKDSEIDLLRKTTLSMMPENFIADVFKDLESEEMKMFNFPSLITKIKGPAAIVIPIAVYA